MPVYKQRYFQCVVCVCYLASPCQPPLTWHTWWGLMISSLFSSSSLVTFSIIPGLSSSVWRWRFSQLSLFSCNQETSSVSAHNPWCYLQQGGVVKLIIGLWTSSTTLFLFFFKPVPRTDKEYLPPRSSGLLQLCTLTGATSRLSQS